MQTVCIEYQENLRLNGPVLNPFFVFFCLKQYVNKCVSLIFLELEIIFGFWDFLWLLKLCLNLISIFVQLVYKQASGVFFFMGSS